MPTITLQVPATTANLGAGFDALGLALDLYCRFTFTPAATTAITCQGLHADRLATDASNLAFRAFAHACAALGRPVPAVALAIANAVPIGSGLGSSSAAIVGGVVGAVRWFGADWSPQRALDCALELEGHPDNIAPALLGGAVVAAVERNTVHTLHFLPPPHLTCLVATPHATESTHASRGRLPRTVPLEDAVFNLSRTGLLVGALLADRLDLLGIATQDRLHQTARLQRLPGAAEAMAAAVAAGAKAAALSGSGPSVLALVDARDGVGPAVAAGLQAAFAAAGVTAEVRALAVAALGAWADGPTPESSFERVELKALAGTLDVQVDIDRSRRRLTGSGSEG